MTWDSLFQYVHNYFIPSGPPPHTHTHPYFSPSSNYRWYLGKIKYKEAEKLLMEPFNGFGSYLVRESESRPGCYALSVRDVIKVRHYMIYQSLNGLFYVTKFVSFHSIQDLVTYYQQQAEGLCIKLIHPCSLVERSQPVISLRSRARCDFEDWEIRRDV